MFHGDSRATGALKPGTAVNQAQALEYFEQFINASSLKNILGYFRTMCEILQLKSTYYPLFYPKLKSMLNSWKAKAIWKKLDSRSNHKCYGKGRLGEKSRVLIIGAGPCGLRAAIEAQLLGCKVVVVEKRDRLSRNNVLHLWPFVIEDLRALGAKKFFGKFCAGAIDHISIRQLQCILFKVALILGVEIHTEVSFEALIEPNPEEKIGWRADLKPSNHPVSQYEFDVILGADGKRNTLTGFKRKEFRGKLAIAITANFINKRTEAEARVEEISGVAFIFNQKFFKDLYQETGIDLENIVYYKDDTHYFVMTAKKPSLIEKGVIIQDLADTERLLAPDNVNREALLNYAKEAADFSTNYQMPDVEFAVNHYGHPDVAMFDFTSMYAAENASKVLERNGYQLLMILVGDSLLEPFWPTGSGCARGFLSSLDAAWAIRSWSLAKATPLEVLAERESIYRLLAQTTPDNLNKDWKSYTLDPSTRYPNLNRSSVSPHQLVSLYDTDDIQNIEKMGRNLENLSNVSRKRRRDVVDSEILIDWVKRQVKNHSDLQVTGITAIFHSGKVLCAIINHYRPDLIDYNSIVNNEAAENNQLAIDVLEKDIGIPPIMTGAEITSTQDNLALTAYLTQIYDVFRTEIPHVKHPKLDLPEIKNTATSFKALMKEPTAMVTSNVTTSRPSSRHKRHVEGILANKSANIERKTRKRKTFDKTGNVEYDNKVPSLTRGNTDDDFAAKIKSIEEGWQGAPLTEKKPKDLMRKIGKIETSDWNIKEIEKKIKENKMGKPIVRDKEKVPKWSREQFVARQTKLEKLDRQDSAEAKYADIDKNIKKLDLKLKEGTNRDLGQKKVATITEKLVSKIPEEPEPVQKTAEKPVVIAPSYSASEFCHFCKKRVYLMERLSAESRFFHHACFKCQYCKAQLRLGSYAFDKDGIYNHKFFCLHHYGMQGEAPTVSKVSRKPSQKGSKPSVKKILSGVSGVDLLDRVRTPERVEFSNLSRGSSDQEDSFSQMDEDEWTDRNFGASTAEMGSSDDDESSSYSDTDSDDEEAYEEAMEEPPTKEGTMKWAERMSKRHYIKQHKSDSDPYGSTDSSSYYENSSDDDESDTATEGEEEIRARELRLQEVRLEPPIIQADTGTDTEVLSDDNSSDVSSEVQNSATEISTDSEFAHDDPTPTSEIPAILLNDLYINMSRGSSSRPKKIQVTSGFLQKPSGGRALKQDIELKLTPLVSPAPSLRQITPSVKPPSEAYALNRTQSTGGIATKVSLELKKRYLLGESIGSGSIQKSGSASTLDTKLKSFCSNISDCQKLLKPAAEISASMQTFCNKLDEQPSPILSPLANKTFKKQLAATSEDDSGIKTRVLPPPDLINVVVNEKQDKLSDVFENETEGRPRSPLHETSLIVPEIDWKKMGQSTESLSTSSSSSSSSSDEQIKTPNLSQAKIPTVEIHKPEELLEEVRKSWDNSSIAGDSVKSIGSDKKLLNQPKTLPGLRNDLVLCTAKKTPKEAGYKKMSPQDDRSSGCSSPISIGEEVTTAFTETELSDWARDGGVSDDLEGVGFDLNIEDVKSQKLTELCNLGHVCGKVEEKETSKEPMSANFDSIEFMDTCTESNSEDGVVDSIGYNLLNNDDIAEDSLNPIIDKIVEATNFEIVDQKTKNSGYCIIASENNNFGGEVITLKPSDIEQLKQNQNLSEREEDSLLVIETTTEENTCSDSTVKNLTEIPKDSNNSTSELNQKQRLEDKLSQLKKEKEIMLKARNEAEKTKETPSDDNREIKNIEFDEHCQRLQSKIDFGNVKDSIDIRKSRRKSKDSPQKSEEEKQFFGSNNSLKDITLNLTPTIKTPDQMYKKEIIEKERDVNQKLIQEMVMSKMRAENKPLERRVRNRAIPSLSRSFQLSKSATTDIGKINVNIIENKQINGVMRQNSSNFLLKEREPLAVFNALQKSQTSPNIPDVDMKEICDVNTPVAPPRTKDIKNTADKLRNDARLRAKMLSNEQLGLSPEDKLIKLREKTKRYDRCVSVDNSEFQLYPKSCNQAFSNGVVAGKKSRPLSEYSPKFSENKKSLSALGNVTDEKKMCRSDSNLLDMKNSKVKAKDSSPKRGIKFTKIMDLFSKKSPKGLFSKISPKTKDTSKSCPTLFDGFQHEFTMEKTTLSNENRVKSFPDCLPQRSTPEVPPPVPPLPLCYTEQLLRNSEESSDDEHRNTKRSSCETIDDSMSSLTGKHLHRRNRLSAREAQLKRHRMAQEIQRKLEETEVKTKELEEKGVTIEKTLRGEDNQENSKQESELLQEWFDIMRDRTELRRYEKELMVRAQELELEDRHARLQHQLRKRLKEENKTEEDKEIDYKIINEMLEIVSKRDSLIALLEEDRLRYQSEDRDFEEQMLSKDLYLTPKWKNSGK